MESKFKMQPGWYYSLDLQPPDSLGNELPVLGIEPPAPSLELIASGTGVVCAAGHVLTVRQVVTHPQRPVNLVTVAVTKQDGSWLLVPVQKFVKGDSTTDLAILTVDGLDLKPACFNGNHDISKGELMVLGFQRGPEILNAGMKTGTTKIQSAFNRNNGEATYKDVPVKSICNTCNGAGKLRCTFCQNGKLSGGSGIGNR